MEYLNKTGLDFSAGQKLKASDLKIMNNSINNIINVINNLLRGLYDLNIELNDFDRTFTLGEAIQMIANVRRSRGMKLRFLNKNNKYVEYSYVGTTLDTIDWNNQDNWTTTLEIVDGGTW